MLKNKTEFKHNMTGAQTVLGWCYLPVHIFILPIILPVLAAYSDTQLDTMTLNIVYYAIGILFVMALEIKYLRRDFDNLLDRPGWTILTLIQGYFINMVLSYAVVLVLETIISSVSNPNNNEVSNLLQENSGSMFGLAVFIGPIVEEVLFRGAVFGSIRKKSRVAAYIVSIALFSLYHVWSYAIAYGDASLLIYAVQYIPVSFTLAWIYERTSSIWASIFFHMGTNAVSLIAMEMLGNMLG